MLKILTNSLPADYCRLFLRFESSTFIKLSGDLKNFWSCSIAFRIEKSSEFTKKGFTKFFTSYEKCKRKNEPLIKSVISQDTLDTRVDIRKIAASCFFYFTPDPTIKDL